MAALVVLQTVVIAVLTILVVGLLRSHGDVLRRMHELDGGIDEGAAGAPGASGAAAATAAPATATAGGASGGAADPDAERRDIAGRLQPGVAPPKETDTLAVDVAGVTPDGSAVHVGVVGRGRLTMLAFLSSGCSTCAGFWAALRAGERLALGGRDVRVVVVTGGPEHEHPRAVAGLASPELTVVMSAEAWAAYQVPATPYFVLIDGDRGVIGEGSAAAWPQLSGLVERAVADRGFAVGNDGPVIDLRVGGDDPRTREARADAALLAAGYTPGDDRLYGPVFEPVPDAGEQRP